MCSINHPRFPCMICAKSVHDKDKAVQCDLCELWIHIKCNKLNYLHYRYLGNWKVWQETRITKQVSLLNNLNFNNYCFESTSEIEISTGGTLLYLANHLSYKCRNDLNIYKTKELESNFTEIVNAKKSNVKCGSHLQTSTYWSYWF